MITETQRHLLWNEIYNRINNHGIRMTQDELINVRYAWIFNKLYKTELSKVCNHLCDSHIDKIFEFKNKEENMRQERPIDAEIRRAKEWVNIEHNISNIITMSDDEIRDARASYVYGNSKERTVDSFKKYVPAEYQNKINFEGIFSPVSTEIRNKATIATEAGQDKHDMMLMDEFDIATHRKSRPLTQEEKEREEADLRLLEEAYTRTGH